MPRQVGVGVRICWAGRSRTRRAEPGSSIRRRGRFSLRLPLYQLVPQVSTANSGNLRKTSFLCLSVSLLPLQILQSANCLNKSKREVTSSFSSNCWWILPHCMATMWNYKKKWNATTNNWYLCWCPIAIDDDSKAKQSRWHQHNKTKAALELNHALDSVQWTLLKKKYSSSIFQRLKDFPFTKDKMTRTAKSTCSFLSPLRDWLDYSQI